MRLSLFQPSTIPFRNQGVKVRQQLEGMVPGPALDRVVGWFLEHNVRLTLTRSRSSKSGDYRPARAGHPPRISVNRTMNPYAFLITLVHEMAHHEVHTPQTTLLAGKIIRHRRPDPHGKQWKMQFQRSMGPFLSPGVFPALVLDALRIHMANPRAATFSDIRLTRALDQFNEQGEWLLLENIPYGAIFEIPSGRKFRKLEKRRTRYFCHCLDNKRNYLFSPAARIRPAGG